MRVFIHATSPFAGALIAGKTAMARTKQALASLGEPIEVALATTPQDGGETLWVEGLFPLLQADDVAAFLSFASGKAGAKWVSQEGQGLLYLAEAEPGSRPSLSQNWPLFRARPAPDQLSDAASLARIGVAAFERRAHALMASGVQIIAPLQTWVEETVQLAPGVVLEPNVQLSGTTTIASGSRISMGCSVRDSSIGENTLIRAYCVLEKAEIGNQCAIGPFAHIRPGSVFADEVRVGNFVETKKTRLGQGSKASHLTYLGDTVVGEACNIGAGTITCNYDGFNKHLTQLGNGVFIGSNSQLIAPVSLADGAYVAAGSTVTTDVPKDSLAIARSRQVTKAGLAVRIRETARQKKDNNS